MDIDMEYTNHPSQIDGIITLLGILPISLLFALVCITQVNRYCFDNYVYDDSLDDTKEELYEDKYSLEHAECSSDPERVVNPNSYVMDYTPLGIICMRYDYDAESYYYWANKKQISYNILETVARKYVSTYSCKELYIDRAQILKEKKELFDEKQRQLKEQEEMMKEDTRESDDTDSENSVFASFKDYNKPVKQEQNKFLNVCDRANSFIHKGTLSEFEIIQTSQYNIVDTRPKLDFETFKRLFANTNNISEDEASEVIEDSNSVIDESETSKKDV